MEATTATGAKRPPITSEQVSELVNVFKMLTNETRLRTLDALQAAEEMCASDLAAAAGVSPQAVSNQLQRLVDRRIVASRRDGNNVYYRIVDTCLAEVLEAALCLIDPGAAA